jgi:methyl-accepting chemotaxis protein
LNHLAKLRSWIGQSVSRRLAIPGLVLVLLLLVQAVLSSGSAVLLVGRLDTAHGDSGAGMKLTQSLLQAAQELSDNARSAVLAEDEPTRAAKTEAFNASKARLGEVVDAISTQLSSDPVLQTAVSEGLSTFVVSGVKATRLAQKGRIEDAQRELQMNFDPKLLAYVISTVTALNDTSAKSLEGVLSAGKRDFWIGLAVTLLIAGIAAFAFWRAFHAVRGSVIEPVQYAALTARRLSTGDYDAVRESDNHDECGELVRAMSELCQQLITRRDEAEAAATEAMRAYRVRSGLDLASSRVLIVNRQGLVAYANTAAQALMERIQPGKPVLNRALDDLLGAADSNDGAVSDDSQARRLRYGHFIIDVVVSTIASDTGELLGRVAEWVDRTEEVHAQQEVASVVQAAGQGDFSKRISVAGKSGYWGELARSLNQLTDTFHSALHATSLQLAALSQGELTGVTDHRYQGLLAKVFDDLAASRGHLARMVSQIRRGSEDVSSVASTINEGNETLYTQGEQLTESISEAVQTMKGITGAVKRNADNALQVGKIAQETRDAAVRGGAVVKTVVQSMADVASTSAKVVEMVAVIDEIAFRTNLLALNAAVEAAHAGDRGRGFAVVASEVRALSQRCTDSAQEIKKLIEVSNKTVKQGTALVASAGETIQDVVERVARMAGVVGEIATDAQQQCSDMDGVSRKIADVEASNRENSSLLQGARESARELQLLAGELGGAVGRFRIEGAAPSNDGSADQEEGASARTARA